jgi:hypothetical protein
LRGVRLSIVVPHDFPEKYLDAVRAAASGCKVKKTLSAPPDVEVVVSRALPAAVSA